MGSPLRMANALYDSARASYLTAGLNWTSDSIKVSLVRGYTPNTATHDFLDDVTVAGGTLVATSVAFTAKTSTAGVADAADVTFTAVSAGAACAHLVIYKDTGVPSTSNLIAVIDSATNLPITPNGGDITVSWDNGANKIFKL